MTRPGKRHTAGPRHMPDEQAEGIGTKGDCVKEHREPGRLRSASVPVPTSHGNHLESLLSA